MMKTNKILDALKTSVKSAGIWRLIGGWVVVLVAAVAVSTNPPLMLERYERTVFDMRMRQVAPQEFPDGLACIMAGEASVRKLGRWPWNRSIHAGLLEKLGGANAVLLDILFPEPSDELEDSALAEAVAKQGRVVAAVYVTPDKDGVMRIILPYAALAESVAGFGIANVTPDVDGVFRSINPLWPLPTGGLAPSLPLEGAIAYSGIPANVMEQEDGSNVLQVGDRTVRMDGNSVWVVSPKKEIPLYEYIDVLDGTVPGDEFDGKMVVVGVGAAGTGDIVVLPNPGGVGIVSRFGAQFMANAIGTILYGSPPVMASPLMMGATAALVVTPVYWSGLMFGIKCSVPVLAVAMVAGETFTAKMFIQGLWLPSLPIWVCVMSVFGVVLIARSRWLDATRSSQRVAIGGILDLLKNAGRTSRMTLPDVLEMLKDSLPSGVFLESESITENELEHRFDKQFDATSSASDTIMLRTDKSPKYHLLLPLPQEHDEDAATYAVVAWDSKLDPEKIRSMAALVSTSIWSLKAVSEMDDRRQTMLDTVAAMVEAVDARDPVTGGHSKRVCDLSVKLAQRMGMSVRKIEELRLGAIVHDIGKLGIPDAVLGKQGKLTDEEFAIIRSHPSVGERILEKVHMPEIAKRVMVEHHEKYAGGGYPRGIKGEEISLEGRISAVADVFDALYSDRPYKKGWPLPEIYEFMEKRAGAEFDPNVVTVMLEVINEMIEEKNQQAELPEPVATQ